MALPALLYIVLALAALLIPESQFPEADYYVRQHLETFSLAKTAALILLWAVGSVPWIYAAYSKGREWSWKALVLPLLPVFAVAVWVRPPFTHDVFLYACQGRQIVVLGVNPYVVPFLPFADDPVIGQMSRTWFTLTSVFGPLSLGIFCLASLLGPGASLHGLGRILKALWLIPYAALFQRFWQHWSGHPHRNAFMLAIFANPFMITAVLTEGHIEVIFLLFLVLAGFQLKEMRAGPAALWLCAATCIKISSIVTIPACACWLWHRNKKKAVLFFLVFLVTYGVCSALVNAGDLRTITDFFGRYGNPGRYSTIPYLWYSLGFSFPETIALSDASFYLSIGCLSLANIRGRAPKNPMYSMAFSTMFLFLTRSYYQYWYTLWFWPLFWLVDDRPKTFYPSILLWTATVYTGINQDHLWPLTPWLPFLFLTADLVNRYRLRTDG